MTKESSAGRLESRPTAAGYSFYYYVNGERVQLTPSLGWVSVKFVSDDPSVRASVLQNYASLLGPLDQMREIPSPELTLLPLHEGMTLQDMIELISAMRMEPGIFLQANPIFQTEDIEMVIGDEFFAAFSAEKSQAEIDSINSSYAVEMAGPVLGQENTFILRVTAETKLDALSLANLYQESGLALHAAPNFIRIK